MLRINFALPNIILPNTGGVYWQLSETCELGDALRASRRKA
jgi:hypothetical protein